MKTLAIATAVALSGFAAMGADTTSNTPSSKDGTWNEAKPAENCCQTDSCAADNDTAWVDIETITIEAANGDPIAQYAIAYITDTGAGDTEKDPEKANEMYRKALPGLEKAAAEGNPRACRALAQMYAEGKGVEKNEAKAKEYMEMCKKCCEKDAAKKKADEAPAPAADAKSM